MDEKLPSTRDVQRRLTDLLGDINQMMVSRWPNDPRETPDQIGETVGLMLQVVAGLMGEIDAFIGSVDTAEARNESSQKTLAREETELVDLVSDEPISSLMSFETPFETI